MANKIQAQVKFLDAKIAEFGLEYKTPGAAAFDLRAVLEQPLTVEPGETKLVPTGLAVWIANPDFAGVILPRSGTGHKQGIVLGNGTGLIDSDYQDQLYMSIYNRSKEAFTIEPYDRIAQYVVQPVYQLEPLVVEEFSEETQRNLNGFGSSGKQ